MKFWSRVLRYFCRRVQADAPGAIFSFVIVLGSISVASFNIFIPKWEIVKTALLREPSRSSWRVCKCYIDENEVIGSTYLLIKIPIQTIQDNHTRLSRVCQYEGCLMLDQDRSSQNRLKKDRSSQNRTSQVWLIQARSSQDKSSKDRSRVTGVMPSQVRRGHVI